VLQVTQALTRLNELLTLWCNERRSLLKARQHILNECEALFCQLPERLREELPEITVRARLNALKRRNRRRRWDTATKLRLLILEQHAKDMDELDERDHAATAALEGLVTGSRSSLCDLPGLDTRSVAVILVETGDARRFTEGGFARFNGTAPIPASSGEGAGDPIRHRLNRGGNRMVNAVLHRMAVTQVRIDPRARRIRDDALGRGHTRKEAMRIVKRHLSNVVYRRM
jgi:transposase